MALLLVQRWVWVQLLAAGELYSVFGQTATHYHYFYKAAMKPTPSCTPSKLTLYQEYRNKTKTDLNCSTQLLSGIDDLDRQMKQYQQLKTNKLSQTQIEAPKLKEISNAKIPNKQPALKKYKQEQSQRTLPSNLEIIQECQITRQVARTPSNMSSRCVMPASTSQKALKPKVVNANRGEEDERWKVQKLKAKTKQLQMELLQAFSGDAGKKAAINKQFLLLFKLLE